MLLFCYLVLQQGSSSPQAPYKRSLGFKHTQRLAYFPLSPGRLTTCQWRTRPPPRSPPLLANPLTSTHAPGFCGCSALSQTPLKPSSPGNSISNRAHFLVVSGCGAPSPHPTATTSSIFTKLHEALTFYSQAIRSYLECVTRAILHHLTDQEPSCKAGPGMSRYRFGEKREWGM